MELVSTIISEARALCFNMIKESINSLNNKVLERGENLHEIE